MLNLFDDLYQHFKQKAAMYPNISVDTNFSAVSVVISKIREPAFHGIVITRSYIYYQYTIFSWGCSHDIVKKVEWSDPRMLETIDGWMREMALQ